MIKSLKNIQPKPKQLNRIISEAKIDIEIQKQKFLKESKKHIASAATTLSEKILKQHVDSKNSQSNY